MKFIIQLDSQALNDRLKPLVVRVFMQLKQLQVPNKGILLLISLFGNPVDVVEEYQRALDQGLLNEYLEGSSVVNNPMNLSHQSEHQYQQQ